MLIFMITKNTDFMLILIQIYWINKTVDFYVHFHNYQKYGFYAIFFIKNVYFCANFNPNQNLQVGRLMSFQEIQQSQGFL